MTAAFASARALRQWVRKAYKWPARHLSYSVPRTINGRRLRIPITAGIGPRNLRRHEPEVMAMLGVLLDRYPGAFIDVGVNIGQTLLKVVTKDPARRYIGFEPSLLCCHYVERLISENNLTNCTILPLALAERAQAIDLHFSSAADGGATIVENFWSGKNTKTRRRTIWAEKGDDVVESLRLPSLGIVKIDVEGAEVDVLAGFQEMLARYSPFILVEVLPYTCNIPLTGGKPTAVDIRKQRIDRLVSLLDKVAYVPFRYQPDGVIAQTVEFDAPQYDPGMCNYLLAPKSRQTEIGPIEPAYRERLLHAGA